MAANHSRPYPRRQTSWFGVALGLGLGTLAAYHLFKLPPALPILLELYDYGMVTAGGFMSVYAIIGLLTSAFSARDSSATACLAFSSPPQRFSLPAARSPWLCQQ